MTVILVYLAFVIVGDAVAVVISAMVEHFSQTASLLVFFILFSAVFVVGWMAAVRVTERFIIRQS